jgi:hypothetical protein
MTNSIACQFNGVWDGGHIVTQDATLDLDTGVVFNIKPVERNPALETLDYNFVDFDGMEGQFDVAFVRTRRAAFYKVEDIEALRAAMVAHEAATIKSLVGDSTQGVMAGLIGDMCEHEEEYWSNSDIVRMICVYQDAGFDMHELHLPSLEERFDASVIECLLSAKRDFHLSAVPTEDLIAELQTRDEVVLDVWKLGDALSRVEEDDRYKDLPEIRQLEIAQEFLNEYGSLLVGGLASKGNEIMDDLWERNETEYDLT